MRLSTFLRRYLPLLRHEKTAAMSRESPGDGVAVTQLQLYDALLLLDHTGSGLGSEVAQTLDTEPHAWLVTHPGEGAVSPSNSPRRDSRQSAATAGAPGCLRYL